MPRKKIARKTSAPKAPKRPKARSGKVPNPRMFVR